MRQFFKFVFASCLGVIVASFIVFGILFLIIGGIASTATSGKSVKLEPNSVLHLKFDHLIPEQTNNLPMNPFEFDNKDILGLNKIIGYIEHAKTDANIKAIYLDLSMIPVGQSTARTLRQSLVDFKTTGKPVFAYAHYYTQNAYYIASVADHIYVNPIGHVDFRGFGVTLAFFKEMLDNIGVDMQIFYAGQFKSATEPFRLNQMSDENRLQLREFISGMHMLFLADISQSRNISIEELNNIADELKSHNAESSVATGLADQVAYENEVENNIKNAIGLTDDDDMKTISLAGYSKAVTLPTDYTGKDKIAVVYAEGTINDGPETPGEINGDQYVKILERIRKDKNVGAVVLRVNSGGGSVLASDRILKEIMLLREKGIPVVTSMGDLAASGGYYIACMSDSIFAEPNTLTGSIGVFSMLPNTRELFNDKLGIHFDTVRTNKFAASFTTVYKLNSEEYAYMQQSVEEVYDRFLRLVAEGRDMTKEQVHEIAQGRIWTGLKAQEIGLVDGMGGLENAIASAASLANMDKYRLTEYPKVKDPIQQLIEQFMGTDMSNTRSKIIQSEFGEYTGFYKFIKEMKDSKGPQARLPFHLEYH